MYIQVAALHYIRMHSIGKMIKPPAAAVQPTMQHTNQTAVCSKLFKQRMITIYGRNTLCMYNPLCLRNSTQSR